MSDRPTNQTTNIQKLVDDAGTLSIYAWLTAKAAKGELAEGQTAPTADQLEQAARKVSGALKELGA